MAYPTRHSRPDTFMSAFEGCARRFARQPAVIEDGKETSYQALWQKASAIGLCLQKTGEGPESVVGIAIEKSADYIAALLGIWHAGAAFVPLDPGWPQARLRAILKDSGARWVLVNHASEKKLRGVGLRVVNIETLACAGKTRRPYPNQLADLAYMIFTSGSTGKPKGVMIEHRGLLSVLRQQIKIFSLKPGARVLFYLPTVFDASISDIGTTLLSGGALCIEHSGRTRSAQGLIEILAEQKITHVDLPPSVLTHLKPENLPPTLKTIVIGGELCPSDVVRSFSRRLRLINVYGPTEATICTSFKLCHPQWKHPDIGQALAGVEYLLVDPHLRPVKPGQAAELLIAGPLLARAYRNLPELTAKKFIWLGKRRYFCSGDLVKQHTDGSLEFLGRKDRQFKWKGVRVAPEEIENCLCQYPGVRRALVLKQKFSAHPGREWLVAYVETSRSQLVLAHLIKTFLAARLPRYLMPSRLVFVKRWPRKPNGKTDLSVFKASLAKKGAPFLRLKKIWQNLLHVKEIQPHDNFFNLGGDSLAFMEMLAAAESAGLALPSVQMDSECTLARMAGQKAEHPNPMPHALGAAFLKKDVDQLLAAARPQNAMNKEPVRTPQHVLILGATGFLGVQVLAELLQKTSARIYVLVRARNQAQAWQRLAQALTEIEPSLVVRARGRVIPLCGDLALPRFGLRSLRWKELEENIDAIYHLAAEVHLLKTYEQLCPVNVHSMLELLALMGAGRPKALHYASTLAVFAATSTRHRRFFEADSLDDTCQVFGGYAQSKWAAEYLLRKAVPASQALSIYRLGLVTGDSRTGRASAHDLLGPVVRALKATACVPRQVKTAALDVTPVDYAAAALVTLSRQNMRAGHRTYHLANSQQLTLKGLVSSLQAYGVTLRWVPEKQFVRRIQKNDLATPAALATLALSRCFSDPQRLARFGHLDLFLASQRRFDTTQTRKGLRGSKIYCPKISPALLHTYWHQLLNPDYSRL